MHETYPKQSAQKAPTLGRTDIFGGGLFYVHIAPLVKIDTKTCPFQMWEFLNINESFHLIGFDYTPSFTSYHSSTPQKTNMTMENEPIEDVYIYIYIYYT